MTVGIRIKGVNGNVQIDDTTPVFIVKEQGRITPANYVQLATFSGRSVVTFSQVLTTQEPPLIFVRFISTQVVIQSFTITGGPGNWTGFVVDVGGWSQNLNFIQSSATNCDWFSSIKTSTPSEAKVGIRIRNRTTGEVVFDSGYKLVKFVKQDANFQPEGRLTHWILRYSVSYPQGAYFLANMMTGVLNMYSSRDWQQLSPSVAFPQFPNKLLLYMWNPNARKDIPYQANTWNALFAIPGL